MDHFMTAIIIIFKIALIHSCALQLSRLRGNLVHHEVSPLCHLRIQQLSPMVKVLPIISTSTPASTPIPS
jgi:hypothetical protein